MKRLFKTLLLFNRYKKSVQKRTDFFDNSFFNAVPDKPLATRNKPHNNQLCADLSRFISAYSVVSHFLRFAWQTTACDSNGDMLEYQIRNSNYSLLDLLSCNIIFSNDKGNWKSRQAFKTAGDNFRMIDNNTIDIIVPYNEEASRIIEALNGETTISQALELQRKAQQYIVNVYDYTFKKLAENDALNEIKVRRDEKVYIYALKKEFYNNATGLSTEGKPQEAMFV